MKKIKVAVMGLGYVGFPLACSIAKNPRYEVYGFDLSSEKVEKINKKISPVHDFQAEKDIKEVTIFATTDPSVLKNMNFIIVCVPTPVDHAKNPDLSPVMAATNLIAENLQRGQNIILESTVNPGVCEEAMLPILERTGLKGGLDFELAHCPERINPGDEKWNVYNIPRNIGALTTKGTKNIADFYRSFLKAEVNEVSSIKAAEATKIIENTFRDINIAYVNELAIIFDLMGIDILEVIKGASNKPFAFMPHYPGCGVGGHCIPVDPYYLIKKSEDLGHSSELLKIARKVNNSMPLYTINKLIKSLETLNIPIKGTKIGLLGLAYKANTNDLRESPALEIKEQLESLGFDVLVYDPYLPRYSNTQLGELLEKSFAVIIATQHKSFLGIKDWKNIKIIIDGRNCLNVNEIQSKGIFYTGIGRGNEPQQEKIKNPKKRLKLHLNS